MRVRRGHRVPPKCHEAWERRCRQQGTEGWVLDRMHAPIQQMAHSQWGCTQMLDCGAVPPKQEPGTPSWASGHSHLLIHVGVGVHFRGGDQKSGCRGQPGRSSTPDGQGPHHCISLQSRTAAVGLLAHDSPCWGGAQPFL